MHIYSVFARFRFRLRGYSGAKVSKSALTKRLRPTIRNLSFINHSSFARVVEWQTRTFEGRMPKGMRVQVPPRAPMKTLDVGRKWNRCGTDPLFRLRTEKYLLSSSNRIETDHDLRRASGREGNRQIQRGRVSRKNLRRRYFAERSIPRRWHETMDTSVGIPWRNIPEARPQGEVLPGTAWPPSAKVCTNCGYLGNPISITRGDFAIEVLLWLFFLVPGIIYSVWRLTSRYAACPKCKAPNIIPLGSPVAQRFLGRG